MAILWSKEHHHQVVICEVEKCCQGQGNAESMSEGIPEKNSCGKMKKKRKNQIMPKKDYAVFSDDTEKD
jgi:hypothetical protein